MDWNNWAAIRYLGLQGRGTDGGTWAIIVFCAVAVVTMAAEAVRMLLERVFK